MADFQLEQFLADELAALKDEVVAEARKARPNLAAVPENFPVFQDMPITLGHVMKRIESLRARATSE